MSREKSGVEIISEKKISLVLGGQPWNLALSIQPCLLSLEVTITLDHCKNKDSDFYRVIIGATCLKTKFKKLILPWEEISEKIVEIINEFSEKFPEKNSSWQIKRFFSITSYFNPINIIFPDSVDRETLEKAVDFLAEKIEKFLPKVLKDQVAQQITEQIVIEVSS